MKIITIDIPELGNRSYIVHDGTIGVVIDPSRRIEEVIKKAEAAGISLAAVFETHIHNDYVTGGYALATKMGIPYYVSADEPVTFKHRGITPDETVTVGDLTITALSSPGHTHTHLSYVVKSPKDKPALFSGGSLLYGAVGRTDLISAKDTKPLARAQYHTARQFIDRLSPETELYPTHGFGSFCAATETEHLSVSSLREQLRTNRVFTAKDEDSFVQELLENLDVYPAYYAYMAPANLQGAGEAALKKPKKLTANEVMRALHTGAGIVDMRSRTAYAARHLPGTFNIELGSSLATYVGWLIAWDAPLILIAEDTEAVRVAQEQLSLIGRDIVDGQANADDLLQSAGHVASYEVKTFADLAAVLPDPAATILDVRRRGEWEKGHIPDATHIPLHELHQRLREISGTATVWVHCQSGFRAAIAASILSGHDRKTILIDDNYENVVTAGLVVAKKQPYVDEVANGTAHLLDVRDPVEWDSAHAHNAVHIPLGKLLLGHTGQLSTDKPVYVYCASGQRAGMAAHFLESLGFQAVNIGGLVHWQEAGGALAE